MDDMNGFDRWGYPVHEGPEDVPEWSAVGDPRLKADERLTEHLIEQLSDARQIIAAFKESSALKDVEIKSLRDVVASLEANRDMLLWHIQLLETTPPKVTYTGGQ